MVGFRAGRPPRTRDPLAGGGRPAYDDRLAVAPNQARRDMEIRITDVPPGEAPEWVRQAWVGLVVPVLTEEVKKLKG